MFSHTTLIGVVQKPPERRGAAVTVRVMTWREDENGERRENLNFVEVFGRYQDFALSLEPNDWVLVEGTTETSSYRANNGQQKWFTSVKTTRIQRFTPAGLDRGGLAGGPPSKKITVVAAPTGAVVEDAPARAVSRRYTVGTKAVASTSSTHQSVEGQHRTTSHTLPWDTP